MDSDEESDKYLLGFIMANIVGLQHHSGSIHGRALVGLVREPHNPHDPNAIQVLNTHSLPVGYIERAAAAALSPLIDAHLVTVEAIVPNARKKSHRVPCQIHVFARLQNFNAVKHSVTNSGLKLITESNPAFTLSDASHDLPPFWEEKNGNFVNILTDYQTRERPHPLRGGIFADDMGLGKTLTLLSLMAFDKKSQMGISVTKKRSKVESERTLGVRTNATLVVCPPSVMSTWIAELEEHTVLGGLKTYMYYGERRTKNVEELKKYDLVLTTYSTLSSEQLVLEMPAKKMLWRRIILDEAHAIKNFNAQQSAAVCKLNGECRWAVTGTPIQSGCIDLFSIMVFLRFEPFSVRSYWRDLVQRSLDQGTDKGLLRLQVLMDAIALRRTKDVTLAGLPPKTTEVCYVELSLEERELYDQMKEQTKTLLSSFGHEDSLVPQYSAVLSRILRLRQICTDLKLCKDQSLLITNIEDVSNNPELLQTLLGQLQDGEDFDCPICLSPPMDIVITCYGNDLYSSSKTGLSSKVSTLIKLLTQSRDQHPAAKSVVYSQFRKLLLLLEEPLNAADGPTVLLASLRASSAGINLTSASRLYFMEPWWNHAVEEQAMDRVHRIGQKEAVKVVRLIAQNSIEEKMLMLQEKKKQLSRKSSGTGLKGMGMNDIRFLLD
uniref:SWI/SNF-related matrix-associated actin-dependent regulator of chromatin subfamily A member 3-like 1 n=1 Tax=Cajanus cajan TaxID=3821 RepID=A0A151RLG9_CAJCA|nr:Putative SWI/SNF-related matrix-associated actin-dependent regulator of chromatin subfamily A member 3-like 1 [Cajanus cajan]